MPAGDENYFSRGPLPSAWRSAGARRADLQPARRARDGLHRRRQRRRPLGRDHRVQGRRATRARCYLARSRRRPAPRRSALFTGFDSAYALHRCRRRTSLLPDRSTTRRSAASSRSISPTCPRQRLRSRSFPESAGQALGRADRQRHARHLVSAQRQRPDPDLHARGRRRRARCRCPASDRSQGSTGRPTDDGAVRRVHVVHPAADELTGTTSHRARLDAVRPRAPAPRRSGRLRDVAGLVPIEGRHAGLDVPGAPQGPRARRAAARAADRLRRVQHQPDARPSIRRTSCWLDRGRHHRRRQPARRRRVRRGLARGRHVRAQAERVRRLHRRGRVAVRRAATRSPSKTGHRRRQQRRPAGRRRSWCSARTSSARSSAACRSPTCCATTFHGRPLLDSRVRLRRRPGAVPVPATRTRRSTTSGTAPRIRRC